MKVSILDWIGFELLVTTGILFFPLSGFFSVMGKTVGGIGMICGEEKGVTGIWLVEMKPVSGKV